MQPKMILVLALCGIWVAAGCATRPSDSEAERAAAQMPQAASASAGIIFGRISLPIA